MEPSDERIKLSYLFDDLHNTLDKIREVVAEKFQDEMDNEINEEIELMLENLETSCLASVKRLRMKLNIPYVEEL